MSWTAFARVFLIFVIAFFVLTADETLQIQASVAVPYFRAAVIALVAQYLIFLSGR